MRVAARKVRMLDLNCIGGTNWEGALETHAPSRSNFFHFHSFRQKICPIIDWRTPSKIGVPPLRKILDPPLYCLFDFHIHSEYHHFCTPDILQVRRTIRPYFVDTRYKPLYDVLTGISAWCAINYALGGFHLLHLKESHQFFTYV